MFKLNDTNNLHATEILISIQYLQIQRRSQIINTSELVIYKLYTDFFWKETN